MAKKDFDEYYNQIMKQYYNMQNQINKFEEGLSNTMLSPEDVENIRNNLNITIQPIKNSYKTLSYIKYLLDMPIKKEKQNKFKKQNKKKINSIEYKYTKAGILEQNEKSINSIKDLKY